jgi:DNA-binding protein YbaB
MAATVRSREPASGQVQQRLEQVQQRLEQNVPHQKSLAALVAFFLSGNTRLFIKTVVYPDNKKWQVRAE